MSSFHTRSSFIPPALSHLASLSLHDALPICQGESDLILRRVLSRSGRSRAYLSGRLCPLRVNDQIDRKSTRLNSSHLGTSYAVFCLKKKNKSRTYAT